MDLRLQEHLINTQIQYLRESVENYLIQIKVSAEERKGIEKYRDYQITQFELALEKLKSK